MKKYEVDPTATKDGKLMENDNCIGSAMQTLC